MTTQKTVIIALTAMGFCTLPYANAKSLSVTYSSKAELEAKEQAGVMRIEQAYIKPADVTNCRPAEISQTEKQKALNELNLIRQAHGLEPVFYNNENDKYTSAAALMIAATKTLSHNPAKSSQCYSHNAAEGSRQSNLYISMGGSPLFAEENFPKSVIDGLLIDEGVSSLGHRAWLLNPFLRSISFGRATSLQQGYIDGAAVFIQDMHSQLGDTYVDYIAYPYGKYQESWFQHGWYMSFSVFPDKTNFLNNRNVDFRQVKIRVTNEKGKALNISHISKRDKHSGNSFMGLPNALQWKVAGTQNNQRYKVNIDNVMVNGKTQQYEYWFEIKPN